MKRLVDRMRSLAKGPRFTHFPAATISLPLSLSALLSDPVTPTRDHFPEWLVIFTKNVDNLVVHICTVVDTNLANIVSVPLLGEYLFGFLFFQSVLRLTNYE